MVKHFQRSKYPLHIDFSYVFGATQTYALPKVFPQWGECGHTRAIENKLMPLEGDFVFK